MDELFLSERKPRSRSQRRKCSGNIKLQTLETLLKRKLRGVKLKNQRKKKTCKTLPMKGYQRLILVAETPRIRRSKTLETLLEWIAWKRKNRIGGLKLKGSCKINFSKTHGNQCRPNLQSMRRDNCRRRRKKTVKSFKNKRALMPRTPF